MAVSIPQLSLHPLSPSLMGRGCSFAKLKDGIPQAVLIMGLTVKYKMKMLCLAVTC